MRRKLVKQGTNTLTVALPHKWLEHTGLKAGNEVEVEEDKDKIIISGKGVLEKSKIVIHMPDFSKKDIDKKYVDNIMSEYVNHVIRNAYIKGYDIIEIKYKGQHSYKLIEEKMQWLLGQEIVDVTENKAVIKNVAKELEEEYESLMKKTLYLNKQNIAKIYKKLEKGTEIHDEIWNYFMLIEKYCDYCMRVINKRKKHEDYATAEYLMLYNIEKISYQIVLFSRYLQDYNPKVTKENIRLVKTILNAFIKLIDNYFKKDTSFLNEFAKDKQKYNYVYFMKELSKDNKIAYYMAGIMRRMRDMTGLFYGRYI